MFCRVSRVLMCHLCNVNRNEAIVLKTKTMKKTLFSFLILAVLFTSCRTLTSTTYIKANDSFLLGNNQHKGFSVKLKNASPNDVTVHRAPIAGGQHSNQVVKPSETVTVKVEKNTALVVGNKSNDQATVELLVKGDTRSLSMGYKN